MSHKTSAGLLVYKLNNDTLEVFLVHPGGPFFVNKDDGYWSIPKGEVREGEDLLETAKREFIEELHVPLPQKELVLLGEVKQKGGKVVHAWAIEHGTFDINQVALDRMVEINWPPRSGKTQLIPENDRAEFFPSDIAKKKINSAQAELITRLEEHLNIQKKQTITQRAFL